MSQDDKKGPRDGPEAPQDENQIIAERRGKLRALRERGQAYPNDFRRDALAGALHEMHDGKTNETLEAAPVAVAVAGRMMLKRVMGKASFATLQDSSGRIQLYITNDALGVETHEAFKHWDLGDIVGARGTLFKTRTGELSVRVTELRLLAKAHGFVIRTATSPAAALALVEQEDLDVCLLDLNYARDTTSGSEGLDLLNRIQAVDPTLPVVVMTAWGSVDLAVEAMRRSSDAGDGT